LKHAREAILQVKEGIAAGMSEDFLAMDLMRAYTELGLLIGEEVEDDLVEEIFSKFCMGK
jgi:tRNA modification GTPase